MAIRPHKNIMVSRIFSLDSRTGRRLAAALSAVLLALALPDMEMFPLAWMALAPLIAAACRAERVGEAAWLGFGFGALLHALTLPWLVDVVTQFGGLSYPTGIFVVLLLVLFLALYSAAFAALLRAMFGRPGGRWWWALVAAPVAWTALEWARGTFLLEFPWNPLYLTQYRVPEMVQSASWGGAHAVTFFIVAANALWAAVILSPASHRRRAAFALVAAAVPFVVYAGGASVLRAADGPAPYRGGEAGEKVPLRVAVVQGNVPQDEKLTFTGALDLLDRHERLTREAAQGGAIHVVWPEATIPLSYARAPAYRERVESLVKEAGVYVTLGTLSGRDGAFYNTALTVSPSGKVKGKYDKMHLVQFGEYVPFARYLFFAAPLVAAVGGFQPGTTMEPTYIGRTPFGICICYEICFSDLSRAWTRKEAQYLVTITNDAWFGTSAAPYQHFAHTVFRAVECRRSVVRAANTGVSGFVDPYGRILSETGLFHEAALTSPVAVRKDLTFYVRHGNWLPKTCAWAVAISLAWIAWPGFYARAKKYFKEKEEREFQ